MLRPDPRGLVGNAGHGFDWISSEWLLRLAALEPAGRQFGKQTAQGLHDILLCLTMR
ncbi:hypothetical protein X741_25950 [Mesorhizobium sp. LNHC229A00]|nr:hypothetical protein X741_25950 [Mesorhizobium sp. LNHC229A00]